MQRTCLRLKACPKCGGDILVDRAIEGDDVCLQCGFRGFVTIAQDEHPEDETEHTIPVTDGRAGSTATERARHKV